MKSLAKILSKRFQSIIVVFLFIPSTRIKQMMQQIVVIEDADNADQKAKLLLKAH